MAQFDYPTLDRVTTKIMILDHTNICTTKFLFFLFLDKRKKENWKLYSLAYNYMG